MNYVILKEAQAEAGNEISFKTVKLRALIGERRSGQLFGAEMDSALTRHLSKTIRLTALITTPSKSRLYGSLRSLGFSPWNSGNLQGLFLLWLYMLYFPNCRPMELSILNHNLNCKFLPSFRLLIICIQGFCFCIWSSTNNFISGVLRLNYMNIGNQQEKGVA